MNVLFVIKLFVTALAGSSTISADDKRDEGFRISKREINELMEAIKQGHANIVQMLINNTADIDARDDGGLTPLHWAAMEGNANIVEKLIIHGADIEAKIQYGSTPLHAAADRGHTNVVQVLIDHRANIDAMNKDRLTPLHYAAMKGHTNVVQVLIDHKANIDAKDDDGMTPLHYAAMEGHANVVKVFINRGAQINLMDNEGRTPLQHANHNKHSDIVRLLTEIRTVINPMGNGNSTQALVDHPQDVTNRAEKTNNRWEQTTTVPPEASATAPAWLSVLLIFVFIAILLVANYIHTSIQFHNRLQKGDLIGRGHFSEVYKGELLPIMGCSKKKDVVIKTIKGSNGTSIGTTELFDEIKLVRRLPKHPNVVSFIGAVTKDPLEGEIMIVYEFCRYGDLRRFLKKNRQCPSASQAANIRKGYNSVKVIPVFVEGENTATHLFVHL